MSNKFIIFDLETTGLGKSTEICQIGAVSDSSDFSIYVIPKYDISPNASAVNHLSKSDDQLYFRGEKVNSSNPSQAFTEFFQWLTTLQTSEDDKIILVAHNAFNFDAPVLINNLLMSGHHCGNIHGFVDTIQSFKIFFPQLKSFGLKNIMNQFGLDGDDQTHEALQDTKDLKNVVQKAAKLKGVSLEEFLMQGFKEIEDISLS
jgi:DNA polymerase III alpha subunit (gram-positive type)